MTTISNGLNLGHGLNALIARSRLEAGELMAKRAKPILIKVGNHLIDPNDVACVTKVNSKNLYIVRLKSQPNMEYPIWVKGKEIESLLEHFEIKLTDVPVEEGKE